MDDCLIVSPEMYAYLRYIDNSYVFIKQYDEGRNPIEVLRFDTFVEENKKNRPDYEFISEEEGYVHYEDVGYYK